MDSNNPNSPAPAGFFGSPRTPRDQGSSSSPLSVLRNFASLSNRGSPLSPMRLFNKGNNVGKTPDKTPSRSSQEKENSLDVTTSEAAEVVEVNNQNFDTKKLKAAASTQSVSSETSENVPDLAPISEDQPSNNVVQSSEPQNVHKSANISEASNNAVHISETQSSENLTTVHEAANLPKIIENATPTKEQPQQTKNLLPLATTDDQLFSLATSTTDDPSLSTTTASRYDAIACLDNEENEDEKWSDRTSVITKWQHEEYTEHAAEILQELIDEVIASAVAPIIEEYRSFNINDTSELDGSFLSTATMEANNAYRSETGITVSEDSEYESAAEVSFVEPLYLDPLGIAGPKHAHEDMDSLIDGLASFKLITPFVGKESVQPDFQSPGPVSRSVDGPLLDIGSPATFRRDMLAFPVQDNSDQPDRESTPVPFEVEDEDRKETIETGTPVSAKPQNTFKTPLKSIASHLMAQEVGNNNDDSFLSAFASMKVEDKVTEKEKSNVIESTASELASVHSELPKENEESLKSADDKSGSNQFSIESAVFQHEKEHCHDQETNMEEIKLESYDPVIAIAPVATDDINEALEAATYDINEAMEAATDDINEAMEAATEDIKFKQSGLNTTFDALPSNTNEALSLNETFDKTTSVEVVISEPEVVEHSLNDTYEQKISTVFDDKALNDTFEQQNLPALEENALSKTFEQKTSTADIVDLNATTEDKTLDSTDMEIYSGNETFQLEASPADPNANLAPEISTHDKESAIEALKILPTLSKVEIAETDQIVVETPFVNTVESSSEPITENIDNFIASIEPSTDDQESNVTPLATSEENPPILECNVTVPLEEEIITFAMEKPVDTEGIEEKNTDNVSESTTDIESETENAVSVPEAFMLDQNKVETQTEEQGKVSFPLQASPEEDKVSESNDSCEPMEVVSPEKPFVPETTPISDTVMEDVEAMDVDQSFAVNKTVSMDTTFGIEMTSPEEGEVRVAAIQDETLNDTLGSEPTTDAPETAVEKKDNLDSTFGIETSGIEQTTNFSEVSVTSEGVENRESLNSTFGIQVLPSDKKLIETPAQLNSTFGIEALPSVTGDAISPSGNCDTTSKLIDLSFNIGTGQAALVQDNVLLDLDTSVKEDAKKDSSFLIEAGPIFEMAAAKCQDSTEKHQVLNSTIGIEMSAAKEFIVGNINADKCEPLNSTFGNESSSMGDKINQAADKSQVSKLGIETSSTPTVAPNVQRCFDIKFNSTPQDVDIPQIRPSTPIKRDAAISDVACDAIKRHLFDSPAQKPTAIVRPCIDECSVVACSNDAAVTATSQQQLDSSPDKKEETPGRVITATTEMMKEEDVLPVIGGGSTGFNLDYLDDPNFNPFATKSAGIRLSFGTSQLPPEDETEPQSGDLQQADASQSAGPTESKTISIETQSGIQAPAAAQAAAAPDVKPAASGKVEKEKKPKKPLPPKPWLRKKTAGAVKPPPQPQDEEDIVIFMPERKTSSNNDQQPTSNPIPSVTSETDNPSSGSLPLQEASSVSATEASPGSTAKSAIQLKSLKQRKPAAKPASYNFDFLDNADDPNFNPFQTKTKVANVFDQDAINDPFQTKSKIANNFEDKLDDPNFNPFETKSKVSNNFEIKTEDTKSKIAANSSNQKLEDPSDDPNFNPFETKSKVSNNFDDKLNEEPNVDTFKTKSKVINNFDDVLDDPNFNPFETKAKVANNFEDKLDDPNFNPFETKSKIANKFEEEDLDLNPFATKSRVVNEEPQLTAANVDDPPPLEVIITSSNLTVIKTERDGHVKDSTPEFEAVEQQLATEEKHKTREQQPITKKSAVVMTPEKAKHAKMEMDFDFPNHPEESFTHNSVRSDIMGRSIASNESSLFAGDKPNFSNLSKTFSDMDLSTLSSSNSKPVNMSPTSRPANPSFMHNQSDLMQNMYSSDMSLQSMGNMVPLDAIKETLARKELIYQSQLLEKDKELHQRQREIQKMEREMHLLRSDLKSLCDSNDNMARVLQDFERTISELMSERERERVCHEIEKERLARERDQALDDLKSVERSFGETYKRYERTKEVIGGFKQNEDMLKTSLEMVTNQYRYAEDRFERLRSHAESKLAEANEKLNSISKSRESEIAKLHAMQRKAEMRVTTLERTIEEKARENKELTLICDELIAKVGK